MTVEFSAGINTLDLLLTFLDHMSLEDKNETYEIHKFITFTQVAKVKQHNSIIITKEDIINLVGWISS